MNSLNSLERVQSLHIGLSVLMLLLLISPAQSQMVRSEEDIASIVALEQIVVKNGTVQGRVRNKSDHPVRDVQLLVRYTWMWDDEFHPGKTDPGTSTYYTLNETLQPNSTLDFVYKPSPPLSKIAGGQFLTSVKIAGFTEIIPQKSR